MRQASVSWVAGSSVRVGMEISVAQFTIFSMTRLSLGRIERGTVHKASGPRREPMNRSGSAVWHGSLKEGKGTISTQSTALKDLQYSFGSRFADGVGTNP